MGLFEWEERLSRARITRVEQRANMRQQQAIMRQRQTKQMKAKEAERLRIEKAREFALRETPVIWETYQRLGSELDIQSTKVEQLRNVIVELGKAPEYDDDYVKLTNQLREMNEVRKKLIGKIEDACIAKAKAEATPGRGDSAALWEKAQEDGIRAAVAAERRFIELKETK